MATVYDNGKAQYTSDYSEHYKMAEKFAKQIILGVESVNPLSWIKKGNIENGTKIEEAVVELAESSEWVSENQTGANLNAPAYPKIDVQYFEEWNGKQFKKTVSDDQIAKALMKGMSDMDVAGKIVSSLTEGEGYEDYAECKGLLVSGIGAGNIVKYAETVEVGASLITTIKNLTDDFQFVNKNYCKIASASGSTFKTRTPFERLRLIMPYTVYNKLNVEVLASLYNLSKAELLSKITLIDEGTKVFIVDEFGLLEYQRIFKMTSKYVEDALYQNYWLTVSRLYGTCGLFKMAYIETSATGKDTEL